MSNLVINANSIYDRIIKIGRQTENLVSSITFNVNMWIEEYGAGECVLNVRRNGDGSAYPVPMTVTDGLTTWTITDTDTAKKGRGEIQLFYTVGEKVKTSPIFTISCGESLVGDGEPPSGYEDWLAELNRMTAEVEAAKTSADQSAQTAQTAAGAAAEKATEAEQSANTASGFANNASASAESASTSAQAAVQSAEQAAESVTDVEASAQAASQSAQSAESAKQAAQTAESNAQGFAQTASAKAAEAAESAADAKSEADKAKSEADKAKTYADRAAEVELEIPTKVSELENDAGYLTEHQSLADYVRKDVLYNMFPTDSASGAVASFADGADNVPLKSLVVGINPVQSGNGDPSPDNVRPITGWTGTNITTCGKNVLMNTARSHTSNSVTYDVNADGTITANGTATGGNGRCDIFNVSNPSKALLDMFSGKKLAGCPEGGAYNTYLIHLIIDGTVICRDYGNGVKIPDLSQYYGASNLYIDASVRTNYTAENLVFKPMIFEDATYDTYEPYSDKSVAVTFPDEAGTVYGGTLDVTSGVLTVTKGFIQSYNGEILPSAWISDRDMYADGATPTTGAEVCYTLAEPVTYQLTPTEVNSLLGSNTIYADTGDTSVEYRADIHRYIDKRLSQ